MAENERIENNPVLGTNVSRFRTFEADMIGLRIKAYRKSLKWSQKQLAEYLGVRVEQVSKWERGNHAPRREEVSKLFIERSLDFNYIYGGIMRSLPVDLYRELLPFLRQEAESHPQILHSSETLQSE